MLQSDPLFLRPDDSEASRKLKTSIHAIVTSDATISTPDAPEGASCHNAWKWKVIRENLGDDNIHIFMNLPCAQLWETQTIPSLQALQYITDLRLQALRHIKEAELWPDPAEVDACIVNNTIWHVRARTRMDVHWKYEHPKSKSAEHGSHA